MQRCLLCRSPLPRARLQAAASLITSSWHSGKPFALGVSQRRSIGISQQQAQPKDALSSYEQTIDAKRRGLSNDDTGTSDAWSWNAGTEAAPLGRLYVPAVVEEKPEERLPIYRTASSSNKTRTMHVHQETMPAEEGESTELMEPTEEFWSDAEHEQLRRDLRAVFRCRFEGSVELPTAEAQAQDWVQGYLSPKVVAYRWKHSLLWILQNESLRAFEFLKKTQSLIRIPGVCVHWAFYIAIADVERNVDPSLAGDAYDKILRDVAYFLRHKTYGKIAVLPNAALHILLDQLRVDQIELLMSLVENNHLKFHSFDWYHLAARTAEHDIDKAITYLEAGLQLQPERTPRNMSSKDAAMALVRQTVEQSDGYTHIPRLCDVFLRHKSGFDHRLGGILVATLQERGQPALAAQTYNKLFVSVLQPSDYVIEAMLHNYSDHSAVTLPLDLLIDTALRRGAASRNSFIAGRLLQFEARRVLELDDLSTAWPRLCALFNHMFASSALEKLGLPNDISTQQLWKQYPVVHKRAPRSRDIGTMLHAFCHLSYNGQLAEVDPVDVYNTWRSLAVSGGTFAPLLQVDGVYNAFLLLFSKQAHTLINAADVMRDMQTPLPESAGVVNCKPTTVSWNTFLLAFRRHKRTDLADQVLEHMRTTGVPTNQVTWNILTSQAVHTQKLDRVVDVLNRIEAGGGGSSDYIESYLRNDFRDQRGLHRALSNQIDFSADLKSSLTARLEEPAPAKDDGGA